MGTRRWVLARTWLLSRAQCPEMPGTIPADFRRSSVVVQLPSACWFSGGRLYPGLASTVWPVPWATGPIRSTSSRDLILEILNKMSSSMVLSVETIGGNDHN